MATSAIFTQLDILHSVWPTQMHRKCLLKTRIQESSMFPLETTSFPFAKFTMCILWKSAKPQTFHFQELKKSVETKLSHTDHCENVARAFHSHERNKLHFFYYFKSHSTKFLLKQFLFIRCRGQVFSFEAFIHWWFALCFSNRIERTHRRDWIECVDEWSVSIVHWHHKSNK